MDLPYFMNTYRNSCDGLTVYHSDLFVSDLIYGEFVCAEARDGEGRRRGSSCSKWQTAHLAVPIDSQYPGQESLDGN